MNVANLSRKFAPRRALSRAGARRGLLRYPPCPDESRRKLWADTETHPDEADLVSARQWTGGVLDLLRNQPA